MNINDISIITPDILDSIGINRTTINNKLSRYVKEGKFIRVRRGYYLNLAKKLNLKEVSNSIFVNSYISLDTILYKEGVIKQYNNSVYSISNTAKSEKISIGSYNLYNYKIDINSEIGIIIDNNGIRRASKERAILDSLYLRFFSSKYPGDSEINICNIDNNLMNKLLSIYPERIQSYYLKLKCE